MSWKDILKEDNINKGFSWFMPKDKENPIDKFLPDIKKILLNKKKLFLITEL